MKPLRNVRLSIWVSVLILTGLSCNTSEKPGTNQKTSFIDVSKARPEIEAVNNQFSKDFKNQDSVALTNHYASDGMLGSVKGKDKLVSTWHRLIQNALKDGTPDFLFTTNSLASDDEYVVELGSYRFVDQNGNVKDHGKYVVVWKQEGGEWKIYRDNGL